MASDSIWGKPGEAGPRILVAEFEPDPRVLAPSVALGVLATGPSDGPVSVETVASLSECIDRARRAHFDLVVVDERLGAEAEEIVARLRRGGAALVVLQRTASDAAALAWFRRGAAECVLADRDFAALRHAAREQLERVRAARAGSGDGVPAADGILRHLGSAVVLVDAAGEITFANPAAEQILGGGIGRSPPASRCAASSRRRSASRCSRARSSAARRRPASRRACAAATARSCRSRSRAGR